MVKERKRFTMVLSPKDYEMAKNLAQRRKTSIKKIFTSSLRLRIALEEYFEDLAGAGKVLTIKSEKEPDTEIKIVFFDNL